MSSNMRFLVGCLGAGLLAALAVPEVSSKLPVGLASGLVAFLGMFLHKMNAVGDDKA